MIYDVLFNFHLILHVDTRQTRDARFNLQSCVWKSARTG